MGLFRPMKVQCSGVMWHVDLCRFWGEKHKRDKRRPNMSEKPWNYFQPCVLFLRASGWSGGRDVLHHHIKPRKENAEDGWRGGRRLTRSRRGTRCCCVGHSAPCCHGTSISVCTVTLNLSPFGPNKKISQQRVTKIKSSHSTGHFTKKILYK